MTLRTDIEAATRSVVTALGESWSYRRLTSGPAEQTRTFGSWTTVVGHVSGRNDALAYDEGSDASTRTERGTLRVSDALTLYQGDQVRNPDGVTVAIIPLQHSAGNPARFIVTAIARPTSFSPPCGKVAQKPW